LWAVVGLGNPGLKYRQTRHNAGFFLVRRIAKKAGVRVKKKCCLAKIAEIRMEGRDVLLALPQTYMNRSGESVKRIRDERNIPLEKMIVIYDDLDLPLGDIRVRKEGRAGSHRGMVSILESLETHRFPRIRIGIGPLPPGGEAAEFVLSPFRTAERQKLDATLARADGAFQMIIGGHIDAAMNEFNRRVSPAEQIKAAGVPDVSKPEGIDTI
jgi:peptidyl-tRNA hydrolase, PTH1 family